MTLMLYELDKIGKLSGRRKQKRQKGRKIGSEDDDKEKEFMVK